MTLHELLKNVNVDRVTGLPDRCEITQVTSDSRKVAAGTLFIAVKGELYDGHDFISQAIRRGACAIMASTPIIESKKMVLPEAIPFVLVDDTRASLGDVAAEWFCRPSEKLKVIGVTGTNGKTTVTNLLAALLETKGPCAVLGTVEYRLGSYSERTALTTPDAYTLQAYLYDMLSRGARYAAMEVSSHALSQGRVSGARFNRTVFTNLTQDHLDYHGNLEIYFQAKARLFTHYPAANPPVINIDDPYGGRLREVSPKSSVTYGLGENAKYRARDLQYALNGTRMRFVSPAFEADIFLPLLGLHNVYNFLAAAAAALEEGVPEEAFLLKIPRLASPPGRLERIDSKRGFSVFVDYAHSPDAFERILSFLKSVARSRVITIFGCGGNRDKTKRPLMAQVAEKYSDIVVVTSDNPRFEDPNSIIDEIMSGFSTAGRIGSHVRVVDRKEAIVYALRRAEAGDLVAVLGKGHESEQIIGEARIPFSDRAVIKGILEEENCLA